jgi:hypothetical protein
MSNESAPYKGPNVQFIEKKDPARAIEQQSHIMKSLLSGNATWDALKSAVKHLRSIT